MSPRRTHSTSIPATPAARLRRAFQAAGKAATAALGPGRKRAEGATLRAFRNALQDLATLRRLTRDLLDADPAASLFDALELFRRADREAERMEAFAACLDRLDLRHPYARLFESQIGIKRRERAVARQFLFEKVDRELLRRCLAETVCALSGWKGPDAKPEIYLARLGQSILRDRDAGAGKLAKRLTRYRTACALFTSSGAGTSLDRLCRAAEAAHAWERLEEAFEAFVLVCPFAGRRGLRGEIRIRLDESRAVLDTALLEDLA